MLQQNTLDYIASVNGHLSVKQAEFIVERLQNHKTDNVLEIGFAGGRHTYTILSSFNPDNMVSLDINFDKAEFEGIANGFPSDHFAVRWEGLVQVTTLGNYSFYAASDDGSRVIVLNSLVIDHDGEHGMGQFVKGTIELEPGLHPVTVDYFERGGDQGIMIKYSGPDTSDAVVSLRVFHEPANLCGSGYKRIPGAIWGAIDGNEGGDSVEDCGECAAMCSGVKSCLSYECSDTELKCNTNTAIAVS